MKKLLAIALLTFAAGCNSFPTADGINTKLATGYEANAAVRTIAADLLKAGKITSADAENVLQQTDNARAGLDIARTLARTDARAADDKLTAVRVVIDGLRDYLNKRKQ